MLAIILSACLANDPSVCRDYKIPLSSDVDVTNCAMSAPPHFAKWTEEHPGWNITKWRCTAASDSDI
ncbi:MAG: hypothetical protein CTY31_08585 [Hyphomicrobium sp.]|nr:MAG: hypothetical protein CTY31_08585 [Hyphomicrobium sp.]